MKKKLFYSIVTMLVFFCSYSFGHNDFVFAQDIGSNVENLVSLKQSDNITLYFENETDREAYLKNQEDFYGSMFRNVGYGSQVLWEKTDYGVFLGYNSLTSNWSYASGYTLSEGRTYYASVGYSYEGHSTTLSTSYTAGVSINFTADSSRPSKLGIYGDVVIQKIRQYNFSSYEDGSYIDYFAFNQENLTNKVVYRW